MILVLFLNIRFSYVMVISAVFLGIEDSPVGLLMPDYLWRSIRDNFL